MLLLDRRAALAAACGLVGFGAVQGCGQGAPDGAEPPADGIPARPTAAWGGEAVSDLSRLRIEFAAFSPALQAALAEAANLAGPAPRVKPDWVAAWYVMRTTAAVRVPREMGEGLVDGDAEQIAAFNALVLRTEVPWVLANPAVAAAAYLPASARVLMDNPEVPAIPVAESPATLDDAALLERLTARLDERLATFAAERGVPLASIAPDPALVAAARESASLHSDASLALFVAYEAAFAELKP